MKRKMQRIVVGVTALLVLALAGAALASAPEKGDPEPQKSKVSEKATAQKPEITGRFTGPQAGAGGIKVQLFRKEEATLTAVTTVESDEGGSFRFVDLAPGEYVLTPDLASLPEGIGLYRRHASLYLHEQPASPIEFKLGQIRKLELTPAADFKAPLDEPFYVEAFAYDAKETLLFARSEVTVDGGDVDVIDRSENGAGLKVKQAGRHSVTARNGQIQGSVIIGSGE